MKSSCRTCAVGLLFLIMLMVPIVSADNVSIVRESTPITPSVSTEPAATPLTSAAYVGKLKVYVVEPISRFRDDTNQPYENGFVNWSIREDLNIADGSIWEQTEIFDATDFNTQYVNYSQIPITESNIMAIAAVFSRDSVLKDAYPGNGYYFYSHYNEAAAAASPGNPGKNITSSGATHTVFIEEGTATW